jgi:carbon-monoxide dehydrogenase medium subunit
MHSFDYARPRSVDETVALLGEHGGDATLLAGGQSLMILLRQGLVAPSVLVGLDGVDELRGVSTDGSTLTLGSMQTYAAVAADPAVTAHVGILAAAAGTVGSVHIRNRGTVGGSLCHADPAGDVPTVLLTTDTVLQTVSSTGERRERRIDEFFKGLFETALDTGELLVGAVIPAQPANSSLGYRRHSFRAGEYPMCVAACRLDWDGSTCTGARVAVGGGGTHPTRLTEIEQRLVGTAPTPEDLGSIGAEIEQLVRPIADVRGSSDWKSKVVAQEVERALAEAMTRRPSYV